MTLLPIPTSRCTRRAVIDTVAAPGRRHGCQLPESEGIVHRCQVHLCLSPMSPYVAESDRTFLVQGSTGAGPVPLCLVREHGVDLVVTDACRRGGPLRTSLPRSPTCNACVRLVSGTGLAMSPSMPVFPRAWLGESYDFSFSGFRYRRAADHRGRPRRDWARGRADARSRIDSSPSGVRLQDAVVDVPTDEDDPRRPGGPRPLDRARRRRRGERHAS